jgi:hypothetical protein
MKKIITIALVIIATTQAIAEQHDEHSEHQQHKKEHLGFFVRKLIRF